MNRRLRGDRGRVLRRHFKALTVAIQAAVLWGCSFSATFDSPRQYRLAAVNDDGLPTLVGFGVTVLSGSLELDLDGSCLHTQRIRQGNGSEAQETTREIECEWSRSGDEVEFTFEATEYALTMSGVIQGESLTVTRDTGIRCVTEPCPAVWIEAYERDRSGG